MRLPPSSIVTGVRRWLELFADGYSVTRANSLLITHETYNDLTPSQYMAALSWVDTHRFDLTNAGDGSPGQQIIRVLLSSDPPSWFQNADDFVTSPDEIPSDLLGLASALDLDPESLFAEVCSTWGKVNVEERSRVGAAGERALVAALACVPGLQVDHVSQISDGFGYDVAVNSASISLHLEAKSTTRRGRFTFYLSRHEYQTLLRDPSWRLAYVVLDGFHNLQRLATVPREWIQQNIPIDSSSSCSWESCKLVPPSDCFLPGLPALGIAEDGKLATANLG